MNRKQRRDQLKAAKKGMSFAQKATLYRGAVEYSRDLAAQMHAADLAERSLYLILIALGDAFSFGPKRTEKLMAAWDERCKWYKQVEAEEGEDAAYERLRRSASRVYGKDIIALYSSEQ